MGIEEVRVGSTIMYQDKVNKFLFVKSELKKAKERYAKELAKKIVKG